MAYIYKITNHVNGKCYIGKTEREIALRFKEHLAESKASRAKDRPLYRAINKYGIENFTISLIEETDDPETREVFWIAHYNTYSGSGYNATIGGEGSKYLDYDLMLKYYLDNKDIKPVSQMAKEINVDYKNYCLFIKSKNLKINKTSYYRKAVILLETGQRFDSITDAAKYVISLGLSKSRVNAVVDKISLNCRKLRKSAFTFTWIFA